MKTKFTFIQMLYVFGLLIFTLFTHNGYGQYCTSSANCTYGDGLTDFTLGTIVNTSSGCSTNGYGDFTSMSTTLAEGSANTLTVKSGYSNQYLSVWIDLNDNGSFETSERLITDYVFNTSSVSTTLNIPSGASPGAHRLRAVASWNGSSANYSCGSFSYGEVEDYTIIIGSPGTTTGPMAGTYTIAPTGGNYASFNAAQADLASRGVSGAVNFYVASGTYTEQVTLAAVTGASSTNTITFQSLSGNAADVILQYSASSTTDNWTFRLNGADYITLKNMTFSATGTTYGRVIELYNGANYNVIDNNIITMSTTTTSTNYSGIYAYTTGKNEYNTISNNQIIGGYHSIYFYCSSTTPYTDGNIFSGNTLSDFYYYGLYFGYMNNLQVTNNIIENRATGSASVYGARLYYTDNMTVTGNKINVHGTSTHYGMYIYYSDGTSSSPSLVANNFISLTGSGTSAWYGISMSSSTYINFYFNSFNITGGSSTSRAMYQTSGSNQNYKNNIFANSGGGYAIYFNTPSAISSSNNNDIYTSGTSLAYYSGTAYTSLSSYQTASSLDANSFSVDPGFTSSSDLHIMNSTLDSAGIPITGITTDFDGDIRNTLSPDIGADEFTIPVMSYVSSTTTQANTSLVNIGGTNQEIIKLEIEMLGALSPQSVTSITFNTSGTTSASDIANAKVFYTGNTDGYSAATQFGSTSVNPNGSFTITGTQALLNGTNYFWLAYDIAANAVENNFVDATCTQFIVGGSTKTPTVSDPTGNRKLTAFYYFEPFDVSGNWATTTTGTYAWTYSTDHDGNGTPSSSTGPAHDHGNVDPWGFYFVEASNTGGPALITSPTFDFTNRVKVTFSFYYHMYGSTTGSLHLDAYYDGTWHDDITAPIVGQQQTDYADPWLKKEVNASVVNGKTNVQFRLRAESIGTYAGDISIDDIEITAKMPFNRDIELTSFETFNTVSGIQPIKINFVTNGIDTVTSAKFNYSINGVIGTPYTWTGSLPQFSNISSLTIGSPNISAGQKTIKAWVFEINGQSDEDPISDTISTTLTITTDAGIIAMDEASIQYGTSPISAFVANYGTDVLTSASVNWSVNGAVQTPASWTGSLTNSAADGPVSLGNYTFSAGTYIIKIWTSDPNSLADDNDLNDTLTRTFTFAVDAGISQIDPPGVVGNQNIVVHLKNFGTIPLTSATINYEINSGTTQTYNWTGNLAVGATDGPITIGTGTFNYGAQSIEAWTSSPNGGADANAANDGTLENFTISADLGLVDGNIMPQQNCGRGNDTLMLKIQNLGTGPVTGPFSISYKEGTSTTVTETVPASVTIAAGDTYWHTFSTLVNLAVTGQDSTFDLTGWVSLTSDANQTNDSITGQVESWYTPTAPIASGTSVAYGTSAALSATLVNGDSLNWYDDQSNLVATGATYNTPALYDTTLFYVTSESMGMSNQELDFTKSNGLSVTPYMPVYGYYDYSWSRFIYFPSDLNINGAGNIKKIAFHLGNSTTNYTMPNQRIYMMHTTDNTILSNAYFDPTTIGATLVYDGTINYNGVSGDWQEIVLQNQFSYNGTDNLIIIYENRDGNYASGYPTWRYSSTSSRVVYKYADGTFPTSSGTISSYLPNIKLSINTQVAVPHCESAPTAVQVNVTGIPSDAGISAIEPVLQAGSQNVNVTLKNFTSVLLTGVQIDYEVNGTPGTTYVWSGSLGNNGTDDITIGTGTFVSGSNTIKAWSKLPNGSADPNNLNDTTIITFNILADIGVVAVQSPTSGCALGSDNVVVDITNFGTDTVTNYSVSYFVVGATSPITENITSPLAPGVTYTHTFATPVNLTVSADSIFNIKCYTTFTNDNNANNDTTIHSVNSNVIPNAPIAVNDTINYGTTASLTAISNLALSWYDSPTGGTLLAQSDTFITPVLFDTTTYYVEGTGVGGALPDLLYYKFDAAGTTVANEATSPVGTNPANVSGLTIGGTGLNGLALNGSGGTSSSNVINTGWNTNLTNGFTISFWMNGFENSATLYYIWGDVGASTFRCFAGGVAGAGNIIIRGGGLSDHTITGVADMNPHYIHYVYDKTAGSSTTYVDGILRSTNIQPTNLSISGTGFQIGGYSTSSGLKGQLDEFRIYSYPLAPADISVNLGSGNGCTSARTAVTAIVQNFPALDAGVLSVNSPQSGPGKNNAEVLNITVKNYGTVTLDTIPVAYVIDAGTPVIDTVFATLAPGDTANFSFATTMNLSAIATYNVNVYTDLDGDVITNNDAVSVQILHTDYCISKANNTIDGDIGNVNIKHPVTNINLLNNGVALPVLNNPIANKTYSNFTNLSPTILEIGQPYPVSVSQITGGATFYGSKTNIYIDLDQNGILDAATELVWTGTTTNSDPSTNLMQGTLTIPATAVVGNTRMRIVLDEDDNAPPCGNYGYGETEDYTIQIVRQVFANAGPNDTVCYSSATTLTGSGIGDGINNYAWSSGDLATSTTVSPTSTTTYYFSVTDTYGFTAIDSAEVYVRDLPTLNFPTLSAMCVDATALTLDMATPSGGSYYGDGVGTGTFTPATAGVGTHTLKYIYTDIHGCTDSTTQTIAVNALPIISLTTPSAVCYDAALTPLSFATSPSGGTYLGAGVDGSGNFKASIAGAGNHYLKYEYTDANGCYNVDSIIQTVHALPVVNATATPDTVFYGTSTNLSVSATGSYPVGGPTYSYSWTPVDSLSSAALATSQTPTTKNLSVPTTFTVSVTSQTTGCVNTDNVTVYIKGGPLTLTPVATLDTVCSGSNTQINSQASGGAETYTYSWTSNPAGFTSADALINVNPLVTTMYYVTVNDGSNSKSDSVEIYVHALPTATAGNTTAAICMYDSTLVSANLTGASPWTIYISDGTNSNIVTNVTSPWSIYVDPTVATTYYLDSLVDANGCFNTSTAQTAVTVYDLPTVTATGSDTMCYGDSIQVTLTFTGASPWEFDVSHVNSTATNNSTESNITSPFNVWADDMESTTHYITRLKDANGCQITGNPIDSVYSFVRPLPTATIVSDTVFHCYGDSSLVTINFTEGSLWTVNYSDGTNNFSMPNQTSPNLSYAVDTVSTWWTITQITDQYGCTNNAAQDSLFVNVWPLPTPTFSGLNAAYCVDAAAATLVPTPTGGTFSGLGISGSTFTPSTAGTGNKSITYTYTDANGCVNSVTNATVVNALPIVSLSGLDPAYCIDAMADTLIGVASSGGSSPMPTGYCTSANSSSIDEYINNVTINGSTNPSTGTLYSNFTSNLLTTLIIGQTYSMGVTVNAAGYTEYVSVYVDWNRNGTFESNEETSFGSFSVNGNYTFTQNIIVPSTASAGETMMRVICRYNSAPNACGSYSYGETEDYKIILSSGGGTGSGVFSGTGMSGNVFDPSVAGVGNPSITYTYTDANGCINSTTANTVVNALPTLTLPTLSAVCIDANPFAITGASPNGGTWTGLGVSTNSFDPATAGANTHNLTYTFTDANGCTNLDSTSIVVNALPVLTVSGLNTDYCENGSSSTLVPTPTGGTFAGTGITGNVFDPTVNGAGSVAVVYFYTDANGCFNSITNTVIIHPTHTPQFTGLNSAYCITDMLAALVPDSTGGIFSGIGINGSNFDPTVAGVGTHNIKYVYTTAHGCVDSVIQSTVVNGLPTVMVSGLAAQYCQNGLALDTVVVSPVGGIITGAVNAANVFDPALGQLGNNDIIYDFTDMNGCANSDTISTTIVAIPTIALPTAQTVCANDTVTLDPGQNISFEYLWSTGDTTTTLAVDSTYQGISTANYSVVVTDLTTTCSAYDTTSITFEAYPVINIPDTISICGYTPIDVIAGTDPNMVYLWSTGATTAALTIDSSMTQGGYFGFDVTVTSPAGCFETKAFWVIFHPESSVDLGNDTSICINNTITLDAGAGFNYLWSTNETTQTITIDGSIVGLGLHNFSVIVEKNGCYNTDEINIFVNPCTGIDNYDGELNLSIYPNPNNGQFTVEVLNKQASNFNFRITDLAGKIITEGVINPDGQTIYTHNFDLRTYSKGVYMLTISNEQIIKTERIVIQ